MSVIRDQIEKSVRIGVLDTLEAAAGPLAPAALLGRVEAAADISDIMTALSRLRAERLVVQRNGRYQLPGHTGTRAQQARDAGPQRPARKPVDAAEAVLAANGAWMTIAEIQTHSAGLTARQLRDAMKADRFRARACERGGPSAKEYGLTAWADVDESKPATPRTPPRTRIKQVVAALAAQERWLSAPDIARAIGEPATRALAITLKNGSYNGHLVTRYGGEQPPFKRYGLPDWEGQPPAAPTPAPTAAPAEARFGLFSDGALALEAAAGRLDLQPAETAALIAYLVAAKAQVSDLFDTDTAEASHA